MKLGMNIMSPEATTSFVLPNFVVVVVVVVWARRPSELLGLVWH